MPSFRALIRAPRVCVALNNVPCTSDANEFNPKQMSRTQKNKVSASHRKPSFQYEPCARSARSTVTGQSSSFFTTHNSAPYTNPKPSQATSFHLGQLKAKLAKLKRELLTPSSGGGGGAGAGFDVARTGVASIGFIGFPSVGKSTLMSRLTGQHSEAAAYEFTTLTSVPGQVMYNGAPLQIIDLPGIIEGAKDGRGRGRQVIAVAKTCHLIFIVLDVNKPLTDKRVIENELEGFGIRINKEAPNITIKKKDKGGLNITSTVPLSHIGTSQIQTAAF